MPDSVLEIEQKFDIPPDLTLSADALARYADRIEQDVVRLASTYHDTDDAALLAARVTLRRRLGDADTGWQLKIPALTGRTELHWPPDGEQIPAELAALVAPLTGGRPIRPAVRLDVARTRFRLRDPDDVLIAEIALDDVRATGLGAEIRAPRWHEAEVELGPGAGPSTAEHLAAHLTAAGAVGSTSRSKLARALVGLGNEHVGEPLVSAGAVLMAYLSDQIDALVAGHFAVAADAPESVHDTRVATRRFRSTLRTFADCFDAEAAEALGEQLKWYADLLGAVRDPEVMRQRLADALADLPAELVTSDVARRIDEHLAAGERAGREALLREQAGPRYAALLAAVVAWRDNPPLTVAAGRPGPTLLQTVGRMRTKLAKRVLRATEQGAEDMHRARKAGKRTRYAAEAVSQSDPAADPVVRRAKQLQAILGEFQDSVVAGQFLTELAEEVRQQGGDGFTLGALVVGERDKAERARQRARSRARKG